MKVKHSLKNLATLVVAGAVMALSGIAQAAPVTYSFSQTFATGVISGSFTGDDELVNPDGVIVAPEITAFSINFTGTYGGNSYNQTYSLPGLDISGVSWSIGDADGSSFDSGISVTGFNGTPGEIGFFYVAGNAQGFGPTDAVMGQLSFRDQMGTLGSPLNATGAMSAVDTAPVPEPETYAMMLAGLGALAAVGRRQKRRAG
jgi:hypothetical protein